MNIKLNNLVYSGIHGLTQKEKIEKQEFKINLEINTSNILPINDDISRTVDYRVVKEIVREGVEGNSFLLIETLAEYISEKILKIDGVEKVDLTIDKLNIWKNGFPSVHTVKLKNHLDIIDFDFDSVVSSVLKYGGVSFPILNKERKNLLLKEAESYEYIRQPEEISEYKVREQLSYFDNFASDSLFHEFTNDLVEALNYKLSSSIFANSLNKFQINSKSLQKYDAGSIGITPHKDNFSEKDIIGVLILKGDSKFALCSDREGSNPIFLDTTPGNIILMRAPGFFGSNKRPFHYVTDIPDERIVFGLRNKILKS